MVLNWGDGTASVLDTRRGTVLRTVHAGISPQAAAVDKRTGDAYIIANGNGYGVVAVLDAESGMLRRTVQVGERPVTIAVDARAGRVLVLTAFTAPRDPWGWLPAWLRDRLPGLPVRPAANAVTMGGLSILPDATGH